MVARRSGAPRLLETCRRAMRMKHFSRRTEKAYVAWIVRFVRFNDLTHPRDCGSAEVVRFLGYLATDRHLAASSQNQALAALQFLYGSVLEIELGAIPAYVRARIPTRVPNVLEPEHVERVLAQLAGTTRLIVELMYGAGLRLGESVSLRVKDIDLRRRTVTVRAAKGQKDRVTMLPESLISVMEAKINDARRLHLSDMMRGNGWVQLPDAFGRKSPGAARDWRWMWVFPAARTWKERLSGRRFRHQVHETTVQRAIATAGLKSGLNKRVSAHTFRHSFATHILRSGVDIRTVQDLLGHRDVGTTMVYLHVLERGGGPRSPLDRLRSRA